MSENRKNGTKASLDKKTVLLAAGAILGVLLLLLGSTANRRESEVVNGEEKVTMDPDAYARALEARIEDICAGVSGAGKVRAAVTLKGGYRAVYATDDKQSVSGTQSSTVLVGSGSSEEAILVCYENPEIAGVGIVCEGGGDAEVRARIVSLVSATFSIGMNKIFVAAGG